MASAAKRWRTQFPSFPPPEKFIIMMTVLTRLYVSSTNIPREWTFYGHFLQLSGGHIGFIFLEIERGVVPLAPLATLMVIESKCMSEIGHVHSDIVTCGLCFSVDMDVATFICPSSLNINDGYANNSKLISRDLASRPMTRAYMRS